MEQQSFCIVGPQGAGKSTAADHLRKIFPDHETISSGPLWDEILGKHLTHYERTLVQKNIVAEKGEKFFVDYMIGKIKRMQEFEPSRGFIVEGIRSPEIFHALREHFGKQMTFVWLDADHAVRRNRSEEREDDRNFEDRERRDDEQFHIKDLAVMCDVRLRNDSADREKLYHELDRILRQ